MEISHTSELSKLIGLGRVSDHGNANGSMWPYPMELSTGHVFITPWRQENWLCVPMAEMECLEAVRLVTVRYGNGRVHAKLSERKAKGRR
jgi:hypothetical protein